MKVRPVSITQSLIPQVEGPLELVAYCARVSNPANQENVSTGPRLVDYLVRHRHWSPLEMVDITLRYRDWETDRKSTRLNSSH